MNIRLAGVGNIPGLSRMKVINVKDVVEIYFSQRMGVPLDTAEEPYVELPEMPFLLKNGAEIHTIWFVPGEGDFSQKLVDGFFDTVVRLRAPGDWVDASKATNLMLNKKWLVVAEDNNGMVRLIGTKEQPLSFNVFYDSAARSRVMEFNGKCFREALYLKGFEVTVVSGFSVGFSVGFES